MHSSAEGPTERITYRKRQAIHGKYELENSSRSMHSITDNAKVCPWGVITLQMDYASTYRWLFSTLKITQMLVSLQTVALELRIIQPYHGYLMFLTIKTHCHILLIFMG